MIVGDANLVDRSDGRRYVTFSTQCVHKFKHEKMQKKKKKKRIKFIIPLVLSFLTLYSSLTCYLRENNKRKVTISVFRVDINPLTN